MIITAGEMLVEFVSHEKDCGLRKTTTFSGPFPSGAPAIFIDQAARMGAQTKFFGSVGKDAFGEAQLERLSKDGVDISDVTIHNDLPTGTAHVSYYSNGDRIFVFHLKGTASEQITLSNLPQSPYTLHVSGASLGMEQARMALLELCAHTKKVGGKICCDPNVRDELIRDPEVCQALNSIISQSDILMPSEADIQFLYPDLTLEDGCKKLLENGADIVILKMGAAGVRLLTKTRQAEFAPHTVTEIDPTGAGDCFCGTCLGLIDIGYDIETAVKFANAAGAMHVTQIGPMEFNPTITDIENFLKKDS